MPVISQEPLALKTILPSGALPPADCSLLEELGLDIRVTETLADIEKIWRDLENEVAISCYQRFDFVESWFLHLGFQKGFQPFFISGFDQENNVAFLWPFALKRTKLGTHLVWPGEKHANYNMGLTRPDWIPSLNGEVIRQIFETARKIKPFDAVHLLNQPEIWETRRNPFLLFKRNFSPSNAYWADFSDGYDAYILSSKSKRARKRLRWQERRLKEVGELTFERATSPKIIDQFLNAHFEQRKSRFEQLGKLDGLREDGAREFLTDLAHRQPGSAKPPLELYALLIDGEIYSIYGGAVAGKRFSAFFNSINIGLAIRFSAGGTLLHNLIRSCAERNLTSLDLGIGEATYKRRWCNRTDILFDAYLGFTARGKLSCLGLSNLRRLKRVVKSYPRLLNVAQRFQAILHFRR
jgi:CelD/BcsL family acetyltransferase involved in cellulose biosynthesis